MDSGIAPLLVAIWDEGIWTCNSCEENEPGLVWIEFYSMKDLEKFLAILLKSLGDQIQNYPEADDWLCYRMLGHSGDSLQPWRYDAHPNICSEGVEGELIYPEDPTSCKLELSISLRFPVEDYGRVLDIMKGRKRGCLNGFEELTDDQWNYVKRYLPPQPIRGRKRTDDRRALNGILYILRTRCPWRKLPSQYGSYTIARRRLHQWSSQGILEKILSEIERGSADDEERLHPEEVGYASQRPRKYGQGLGLGDLMPKQSLESASH